MKSSTKNKSDFLLITFISLLLIFVFFICNKTNIIKLTDTPSSISEPVKRKRNINSIIKDYQKEYSFVEVNKINNKLTSILVKDDSNNLKSFIYENDTGKEIELKDMFKKNCYEEFVKKSFELLSLKYASFIVSGIKEFPGDITYQFKNNEVIIYYKNYVFNPSYNGDIVLHVNYNEIDDYLNFKHVKDDIYTNENGFNYDPKKPTVAISFDDGPNGENTIQILKALEDNKMCATFFMVGNKMNKQKHILKAVTATHSEIGSHTYSHINMKRVDMEKVKQELTLTDETFKNIMGFDIKLVRPPYGAYTDDIIKDFPYSFILWNSDTDDWKYKDVEYIVNYILEHAHDGNIILMHDSYETSVEAVKIALPRLYARGIQVVSVSKLAELKNIDLAPGTAYRYIK